MKGIVDYFEYKTSLKNIVLNDISPLQTVKFLQLRRQFHRLSQPRSVLAWALSGQPDGRRSPTTLHVGEANAGRLSAALTH